MLAASSALIEVFITFRRAYKEQGNNHALEATQERGKKNENNKHFELRKWRSQDPLQQTWRMSFTGEGYKVLLIDNDKQGNLSKAYSRYDAENVAPVTRLLAGDWESAVTS